MNSDSDSTDIIKMQVNELDSFVQKFNQLWKAGFTAHLDLDTHAGNAWVGLRVQLGPVPVGPVPHPYYPPPSRHRGPSYHRRLEKRRAARSHASPPSSIPTAEVRDDEQSNGNVEAGKATINQEDEIEDSIEKVENVASPSKHSKEHDGHDHDQADAEKANMPEYYDCPICDFRSSWNNGLRIHMNKVHTKLEQIDGSTDAAITTEEQDAKYLNTAHYWEKGRIGIAYHSFLDASCIIDNCDELSDELKAEEKSKLLEARKYSLGSSFENFPPWKIR